MVDIQTLSAGMRVKIVDYWGPHCDQNDEGNMDKYLGAIVTIKDVFEADVFIEEDYPIDGRHWYWNEHCIDYVVYEDYEIDIATDDELLELFGLEMP